MPAPAVKRASLGGLAAAGALALAGCGFGDDEDSTAVDRSPTDVENVALDLRPESAAIESMDLDDDEQEFVRLIFTREIQEFDEDGEGLFLQGFDPDEIAEAESVELVEDDTRSLLVGFEEGTNIASYTVAVAEDGVVEDAEGSENIQDAVELAGGIRGRTAAPELVAVSLETSRNRIEYAFDERLDEGGGDASEFGYHTADGASHTGDELVSVEDGVVVVEFDEDDGAQVEEAERPFVRAGAVEDQQGSNSVPAAQGAATAAPDLRAVEPVAGSDTQWDLSFDETVEVADEGQLAVYTADGDRHEADAVESVDGQTVRATFEDVEDRSEAVTVAAAGEGAVRAVDPNEGESTVSAVPLAPATGGQTAGPDLVGAELEDASTGRVRFVFDEALDEDADPEAEDFFVVTESGETGSGDEVVEVGDEDERFLTVTFDEDDVRAAAGFSLDAGAVEDVDGDESPLGTVEAASRREQGGGASAR